MGTTAVDAAAAAAWTTTKSRSRRMRHHSFFAQQKGSSSVTHSKMQHLLPFLIQKKTATSTTTSSRLASSSGADIELSGVQVESSLEKISSAHAAAMVGEGVSSPFSPSSDATPILTRGKVNEIDFTIAPADVSLSRAYGSTLSSASTSTASTATSDSDSSSQPEPTVLLSLTRALNNASNRAIRRIMLARSWPSAKALNLSLRRVAELERQAAMIAQQQQQQMSANVNTNEKTAMDPNAPKCPVPRPILNVLMRKREQVSSSSSSSKVSAPPIPRKAARSDEEYVADQLQSFQTVYGHLPGYAYAEAYLESVLSLATSGIESMRVQQVMESKIYDESYRRILSVLRSVGVVFEPYHGSTTGQRCIAKKLQDQDVCLSILDKIRISKQQKLQQQQQQQQLTPKVENNEEEEEEEEEKNNVLPPPLPKAVGEDNVNADNTTEPPVRVVAADTTKRPKIEIQVEDGVSILKPKLNLFGKSKDVITASTSTSATAAETNDELASLTGEDLGGVLLSAQEPSMTAQLNVLANIVQRALLFGGDEELLVLSETLQADRAAFCDRWYPNTNLHATEDSVDLTSEQSIMNEQRPGVQFINCLIQLLRTCYQQGVVTNLTPPLPLSASFANAYERLVCAAVELGSGYLKPTPYFMTMTAANNNSPTAMTSMAMNQISTMPKPRNAQEELGRFALWETNFRRAASGSKDATSTTTTPDDVLKSSAYPTDLEGTWQVLDEIGSETIGQSTVIFKSKGAVQVPPPLEGLRWRLDPGPTHLDTCTFQVLSSDGTILQYRGFLDRGARLEARFSKRPLRIRGCVMFQMRDGSIDYYKDMLPINYKQGTTKFVMTKVSSGGSSSSSSIDSSSSTSGVTTYKMTYGTR
jgi:hypothetical protein